MLTGIRSDRPFHKRRRFSSPAGDPSPSPRSGRRDEQSGRIPVRGRARGSPAHCPGLRTVTLVPDYLLECLQKEIYEVRIIHGKGKGVLRRTVHSILERLDYVADFRLDDKVIGNWGATIAWLHRP